MHVYGLWNLYYGLIFLIIEMESINRDWEGVELFSQMVFVTLLLINDNVGLHIDRFSDIFVALIS